MAFLIDRVHPDAHGSEAGGLCMDDRDLIIEMERRALVRWCNGDPSGFLDICARDVVYFDPTLARRLDGLQALSAYYEKMRGKIFTARFDVLNPLVQIVGNAAILTFNFVSHVGTGGKRLRWNCTEVFRRDREGWRIIQTHWSFTQDGR